uniref:Uncharacterized protein n=1 Tax=Amphilophus citrinellus TaxID=61819 RepID=A0A3Q0RJQ2_AMPCI
MFQGLDARGKCGSRVLQPPGDGSTDLFGGYEEHTAASRPNKMFCVPKRTYPGL